MKSNGEEDGELKLREARLEFRGIVVGSKVWAVSRLREAGGS